MPMMSLTGLGAEAGAMLGKAALSLPSCHTHPCYERWMLWSGLEPLVARHTPSTDDDSSQHRHGGVLHGLGKWLFCGHLTVDLRPIQQNDGENRPCYEPWMLWGGAKSLVAALVPKASNAEVMDFAKWLFCRRLSMSLRPALFPSSTCASVRGDSITVAQQAALGIPWGDAVPATIDKLQPGWRWEWDIDAGEMTVTDAEGNATMRPARAWSDLAVSVEVLESSQFVYTAKALGDHNNRPCYEPWMLWGGAKSFVASLIPKAQFATPYALGSWLFWCNPTANLFPAWWYPCDNRPCYERWMLWGDLYKYTDHARRQKYGWEIFNLSPNWGDFGV